MRRSACKPQVLRPSCDLVSRSLCDLCGAASSRMQERTRHGSIDGMVASSARARRQQHFCFLHLYTLFAEQRGRARGGGSAAL